MNLICKITDKEIINENPPTFKEEKLRFSSRGIVIKSDGKIAIFYKQKKNQYKLPGGGMENYETPEAAFLREVLEETGCQVEIVKKLGVAEEYKFQTKFKQISHVFLGKAINETNKLNITQKEKEEGAKLIWEFPEKALELITNCFDKLIESDYESVYSTKFVVLRDRKILE